MTKQIIIGNAIFFLGATVLMVLGFFRTKKSFLLAQCSAEALMGSAMLILGGYAGFFVDTVTIIRNLISLRWKFTLVLKLIFIAALVGIYASAGSEGFLGWMPILATCLFTWFLDTSNVTLLKVLIVVTQLMWSAYDLTLSNYVGVIFDLSSAVTNTVGIFWRRRRFKP